MLIFAGLKWHRTGELFLSFPLSVLFLNTANAGALTLLFLLWPVLKIVFGGCFWKCPLPCMALLNILGDFAVKSEYI